MHSSFEKEFMDCDESQFHINYIEKINSPIFHQEKTDLHLAFEHKLTEKIRTLLSWGASINVQDNNGDTPMHLLLRYHTVSLMELIEITENAKINFIIENNLKETPINRIEFTFETFKFFLDNWSIKLH